MIQNDTEFTPFLALITFIIVAATFGLTFIGCHVITPSTAKVIQCFTAKSDKDTLNYVVWTDDIGTITDNGYKITKVANCEPGSIAVGMADYWKAH